MINSEIVESTMRSSVETLRLLSLFSGCGGMDLGFEGGFEVHRASAPHISAPHKQDQEWVLLPKTRFETVFANDIRPEAQRAWQGYFSQKFGHSPRIYHLGSIVDLVQAHRSGQAVFPERIDVLTGGFPCQDFSVAGKRKGFSSSRDHNGLPIDGDEPSVATRGQLYMWMKEVIELTLPKIFIAENVKGLVSLENVKRVIQQDFSSAGGNGYIVLPPRVLHAAHFGVPQSRERVIFIGVRRSALTLGALEALSQERIPAEFDPYPQETHQLPTESNGLSPAVACGLVLFGLTEPEQSADPSQQHYSRAKFMGDHCQGQTEVNLDGLAPTIRAEHHGNIEFRRLSRRNGGENAKELAMGFRERRLTPRECALIQTFPRDYEFVIPHPEHKKRFFLSPSAAYKLIGNAVPPLLAYHLAKRLETIWPRYFG